MAVVFPANIFNKAYQGALRLQADAAVPGSVYTFPNSTSRLDIDEGNAYPSLVDASGSRQNKNVGFITGTLTARGAVKTDRGFAAWLNATFGPRTLGKLAPQIGTIVPSAGAAPFTFAGVWWNTLTLRGRFGTNGQVLMLTYEASGRVCDCLNVIGATAVAAAVNEGKAGVGLSTFARYKVTPGGAGGTTYDGQRAFEITFNNGLTDDPAALAGHEGQRLIAGCTPGQFIGALMLSQLLGATQPLPASSGVYPFSLLIPSGDGTQTMSLDVSASYDGDGQSFDPEDYNTSGIRYTLFGEQAGNATGTVHHAFVATTA